MSPLYKKLGAMPVELSENSFNDLIRQKAKISLLFFYNSWSGASVLLKPIIERISAKLADKVNLIPIDADSNEELIHDFSVNVLPSVFILREGVLVEVIKGVYPSDHYENLINEILNKKL